MRRGGPTGQASGASPASMAAAARKVAPMTTAEAPSEFSRSGTSTSTTPSPSPASMVSHMPVLTWLSRRVGHAALSLWGADLRGPGTR